MATVSPGASAGSVSNYYGNASTSGSYRQFLQNVVNSTGYSPVVRAEAQALLKVVGDDMNINPAFESDPYKYTGTSTGHVVGMVNGTPYGYGPEGLNTVNADFMDAYRKGKTSTSGGSRGSSGGSSSVDTSAARNATQRAIDALSTSQMSLDQNERDAYRKLLDQYDQEMNTNQSDFDAKTKQTGQDLATARQLSRSTGAQGSRSLMAQLAALGANGTGVTLANDAVTNQMNREFGESGDTANKNQQSLNTWIGRVKDQDKERRGEADQTLKNNLAANRGTVAKQRQTLLQQMADLWSQAGNKGEAANALAEAGALNNDIALASRQPTAFTGTKIAYTAPELASQSPTSAVVASVQPGSNTSVAQPTTKLNPKKREEENEIYA